MNLDTVIDLRCWVESEDRVLSLLYESRCRSIAGVLGNKGLLGVPADFDGSHLLSIRSVYGSVFGFLILPLTLTSGTI